jgi:glycerol uptake facilitator-like aquaporin
MATTKAKSASKSKKTTARSTKSAATKAVAAKSEKVEKAVKAERAVSSSAKASNPIKDFFARKYDASENILTIFKTSRIIGAVIGEIIGTMLLTMLLMTLGIYQPLYVMFGVIGITIAVFAISGANLNPLITIGMIASRRMAPIRGTLYIIGQILGAWFGMMVVNAFHLAGGEAAPDLPKMAVIGEDMFWPIAMIELVGAIILGFFFARALFYKRSAFTFGAVVGAGAMVAILFAIVVSSNYLQLQDNFIMNPAIAIMYQILPSEAADFGALFGEIAKALAVYILFPIVGGVVGFYVSDIANQLAGNENEA